MDAHFINDLGLDSLDAVEIVMAFEDEFGQSRVVVQGWCGWVPSWDGERYFRLGCVCLYACVC